MAHAFAALLIGALVSTGALAVVPYENYKSSRSEEDQAKLDNYVHGVGNGLMVFQMLQNAPVQQRMFCPPATNRFGPQDFKYFIEKGAEIVKPERLPSTPIESLMVRGLMHTFPCVK